MASQQVLPPHSVSRRLNFAFPRRSTPSSRTSWLLRANPSGLVSRLGLTSSSLLPCWLSIPPVWPDLPSFPARFRMTFAYSSMISSSTSSLRIAWEKPISRPTLYQHSYHLIDSSRKQPSTFICVSKESGVEPCQYIDIYDKHHKIQQRAGTLSRQ